MTDFTFTFTVPAATGPLFAHRPAALWLEDLARVAGISGLVATDDEDRPELVTVSGPEDALRFACVAFNLHAEQTPWDTTPAEQGAALERVLAGEQDDPSDDDPSDVARAADHSAWLELPRCDAEHANLRTYLTYLCCRRGEHHAHLDALGDEWGTGTN